MADPTPFARLWGAVLTEDGPVAEVRDVDTREEYDALRQSDTFRMWAVASLAFPVSNEGHSRGGCGPGRPCKKCRDAALSWWWEHGRRTKARVYVPAAASGRVRAGFDVREWGKQHMTMDVAAAEARSLGFAFVVLMDGHGHRLEWIEVPS